MKTVAIIAEYNPFHNGHKYHLETAKKLTGSNYSVALMSGNFLQRGQAAMWDKYTRAKMCVSSGIDLALELPFPYATGSAKDFAIGAVNILNSLNSIDYLCFGAENADISVFNQIADILISEPDTYKEQLKNELSCGKSFPAARESALLACINSVYAADILSSPNNILALEYICALKKTCSKIKPVIIERKNAGYHDSKIYGEISSATAIRKTISEYVANNVLHQGLSDSLSKLYDDIPNTVFNIISSHSYKSGPVFTSDLTPFLQCKLLSDVDFASICDINREFGDKLSKLSVNISYDIAADTMNTKEITVSRIYRGLIHLILGYTENDRRSFIDNGYAAYASILSFKKDSSILLREIKSSSNIPLITKKADFHSNIMEFEHIKSEFASRMWELDTKATDLYNCLIFNRYEYKNTNDYNTKIPII